MLSRLAARIIAFVFGPRTFALLQPLIIRFWLRLKIKGSENLPAGGCILAANHTSIADLIIVPALRKIRPDFFFLANSDSGEIPLFAAYYRSYAGIIVDRTDWRSAKNAFRKMRDLIGQGNMVGIFPEGERSPTGKLQPAKPGLAELVQMTRCPVVPVGLSGFYEVWPQSNSLPRPGKCIIRIGKPIEFENADAATITSRVMQEIGKLCGTI